MYIFKICINRIIIQIIISKECDIIKNLEKMMAFMGGIGLGIMYKKYEKDIMGYLNKVTRFMK